MSAFNAGIRWADISSESFSCSKTATGAANAALMLQAEQADHSYAPGEAVVLPEFENSHAGMNRYFKEAAAIGSETKNPTATGKKADGVSSLDKASSSAIVSCIAQALSEDGSPSRKMPGFRGLLVGTPVEAAPPVSRVTGTSCVQDKHSICRKQRNIGELAETVALTPAKRNRRTSGPPISVNPVFPKQDAVCQKHSTEASAASVSESTAQKFPLTKRRKSAQLHRSVDVSQFQHEHTWRDLGMPNARSKRRSMDRRRSGRMQRSFDDKGSSNSGMLLKMGASSLLQLPGLVSQMFIPMGLTTGCGATLPGVLHPQVLQQHQARANGAKEQVEPADEEEWQRRECARLKDISIGKATRGYRNFVSSVGRERRSEDDPLTPDPKLRCSKAQFQRAYQKWRKQLHQYDSLESSGEPSGNPPSPSSETDTISERHATSDIPAGSAEQHDLDTILAFNKECDLAGL